MNCSYHPVYRNCVKCGRLMERDEQRECVHVEAPHPERVKALKEAREHIKIHAMMTWRGGQIERSDGITDVLVDFDLKFPEGRDS